jgi:hypothetical protein
MSQKKLQNLLNMAVKATDGNQANAEEIDEERKQWLREAISKALEDDESNKIVLMTNLFLTFKPDDSYMGENLEDLKNLYEELNYLNEGFDIAKIFNSQGGVKHNLEFLKCSQHEDLKTEAANLIGNSTHNNPVVQMTLLENNALEILVGYVKTSKNEQLVTKCLYALSTLVGGNKFAEKRICELVDSTFFLTLLRHTNEKIRVKATFFLTKLVTSDNILPRNKLITAELVKQILEFIKTDNQAWHRHLFNLLVPCLSKTNAGKLLTRPEMVSTVELLTAKQVAYEEEDKDVYEDHIEGCKTLTRILK